MRSRSALTIRGATCVLRDWRAEDVAPYREWLRPEHSWHDTNGPYFGAPSPAHADRIAASIADLVEARKRPVPRDSLVIGDRRDERLIGMVSWYWESEATDWRRVGLLIFDPAVRGRGIGREALQLWTEYLFSSTDALRLDLATYSGNEAMCRSALAAGFVLEARLRKARRWSGGVHDAMIFTALRGEWPGAVG